MDTQFMEIAIEEAKKAKANGDLPFGAVITCNGKIISKGCARNNTTGDVTEHAELSAVREACKILDKNSLEDCVIYCTNEPCIMCAAGIFQAAIPKVVIGMSRADLPHLLRARRVTIQDIAEDSSYPIEIVTDVLKDKILPLFEDIKRNK